MKKKIKILIAVASCSVGALVGVSCLCNNVKSTDFVLPESFTVTAHTGCEGTEDNSLESIRKAYENSADIVEFDLRR